VKGRSLNFTVSPWKWRDFSTKLPLSVVWKMHSSAI